MIRNHETPSSRSPHPARGMARRLAASLALAASLGLGAACGETASSVRVYEGETMGTTFRVQVIAPPGAASDEVVRDAIARVLADVDRRMSTWRDDSEIQELNRAGTSEVVQVSAETFDVLAMAARVSEQSGGAFDITVGPLVEAWGFGPAGAPASPPEDAAIQELLAITGWRQLALDAERRTARKANAALRCDLSAIAKGDGVDRVALALESLGLSRHLVDIGGEMRAGGTRNDGRAWRVAVERPDATGGMTEHVVPLRGSLATSGNYRRFIERDGRRLTHVIDPRDGRPIDHATASVTVLHERCALADAWATALLVLGADEGLRLATERELAALFLVRDERGDFHARESPAWSRALAFED